MLNCITMLLFSSTSTQDVFMCLNMDYEMDTPAFTVEWSLNCLLALQVNEVGLMVET